MVDGTMQKNLLSQNPTIRRRLSFHLEHGVVVERSLTLSADLGHDLHKTFCEQVIAAPIAISFQLYEASRHCQVQQMLAFADQRTPAG